MSKSEEQNGRTRITLPLSESERAEISRAIKVRDAAWAEYGRVRDTAWVEYEKVRDAAWAECGSDLAAWVWGTYSRDFPDEADFVLDALASGANLDDLRELARLDDWCSSWSDALHAATERFGLS